jgi:hypothetical protein
MTGVESTVEGVRAAIATIWMLLASSSQRVDASTKNGILIFAVGIVVGTIGVCAAYWVGRRRMAKDYQSWVAAGRPERRIGERRGVRHRRGDRAAP